jgi:hypothetical protein
MHFQIGIAVHALDNNEFAVAAIAYTPLSPHFSLRAMTLPYIRKHLHSTVLIRRKGLEKTINTAVNRSIERLLIRGLITPSNKPDIELLVKPALRKLSLSLPHSVPEKHWLVNTAQKALDLWLQGAR